MQLFSSNILLFQWHRGGFKESWDCAGKEVTEVFIRRDYENYGEKVKDVEE